MIIVLHMAHNTKRLSVVVDHRLLDKACRLTRLRGKRATITKALEELVKL
jgi:Arc/MetJ family transcription regulator